MKLNKKPMFSSTGMAAMSLSQLQDAMNKLTQVVSEVGQVEVLRGVIQYWPFPLKIREDPDGTPIYLDTAEYEFRIHHLLEAWGDVVPQFVERHFNEVEPEDYDAILNIFMSRYKDAVMSMGIFVALITSYFDEHYPIPEPEMLHSLRQPMNFSTADHNTFLDTFADPPEQKDYFMPGLKVLNMDNDGLLWSPVYSVAWVDNELEAKHLDHTHSLFPSNRSHEDQTLAMETCDCGIYASVNLGELWQYLNLSDQRAQTFGMDDSFDVSRRRLCIIEPASDATVYMARKGWKASKAFVSEIVGETISPASAAELISMVWRRPIDIRKVFDKGAYK